jgi:hypothetical protein
MESIHRVPTSVEKVYYIDGYSLTPDILENIIQDDWKIDLSPQTWDKVKKSR